MRGRKPEYESRATEFRQRLSAWRQIPGASRPSLRALARELGTSHQLLKHYLDRLEKWQYQERFRKAKKQSEGIRARAAAEGRYMTPWEEQQVRAYDRATISAMVAPMLVDQIEQIRQDAKRGPLHRLQFKMLEQLAKQGFPGAQEVLQECASAGLKKRKQFGKIVKETPREEGETCVAWVRRIWDQCARYETNCPEVITEELLHKYS